ncbi:MAG TPA: indole-3-glycerol phosphate synthase TrpC [Bacillota bacterium]|nr:indole-3-glycerol phosphate synthase TrpC [Bacillota bacterium]HPT88507.1 indole-3-glycerol phosphate synthase TrpC [Bacillota bacterium]
MFLEKIIARQRLELEERKKMLSYHQILNRLEQFQPELRPFSPCLTRGGVQIIAEVKQASPSKGLLTADFQPGALAQTYEMAGAAAISVLTEPHYFRGSLADLQTVKEAAKETPVLRKDFIIDRYQLAEARLFGADAVLLIVAVLTPATLMELIRETLVLGMTPLVEVHQAEEIAIACDAGAEVIGINNRDLKTFEVSLETTFNLRPRIPAGITVISESGIHHREDLILLKQAGVHGVLIGEALVTHKDPASKIRDFLEAGS